MPRKPRDRTPPGPPEPPYYHAHIWKRARWFSLSEEAKPWTSETRIAFQDTYKHLDAADLPPQDKTRRLVAWLAKEGGMDPAIVEGHAADTRKTVERHDDVARPPVQVRRLRVGKH